MATTVLLRCRVADYDAWRPQYDHSVERITEIRPSQVWRGQDDPNLVVVAETFDSREVAEAAFSNPVVQEEMPKHGVDMSTVQIDYLDEVTSGRTR